MYSNINGFVCGLDRIGHTLVRSQPDRFSGKAPTQRGDGWSTASGGTMFASNYSAIFLKHYLRIDFRERRQLNGEMAGLLVRDEQERLHQII